MIGQEPRSRLRRSRDRRNDEKGFTLLELLVTLVLMTLLITVAPALLSGGTTTEMRGAARQLAAALRAARNQAVTRQQEAVLTLDLAQRSFSVSGFPRPRALPDDQGIEVKLYTAQSELLDENRGQIRFFPDGSSTGGNIALLDQKVEYRVNVDWLTGRIVIEDRTIE